MLHKKRLQALLLTTLIAGTANTSFAQKPEDTEQWKPVPQVVTTKGYGLAPADAIILFDGDNLNQWVSVKDSTQPAGWTVSGDVFTVKKGTGNIRTKQAFGDYQLHLEFRIPKHITGKGQGRGNSGLFLASIGGGDDGYELQILDSYQNETYVNGQAGSIYKQTAPLANPNKAPGEWNVYDIAWKAPRFKADGSLETPAMVTVFMNGVLVQNHTVLQGPTQYIGKAAYRKAHGPAPIKLQDHGDPSEPISFRNIWIRPL